MQAILLISIFSLMVTVVAGIMSGGSSNVSQLNKMRIDETHTFFQSIANVTLNDVTLTNMQGNPQGSTTPAAFIQNLSELRLLSSGRLTDPALDAWGHAVKGVIVTENQLLTNGSDPDNKVSVPVTGIVLVSGGPDGVIQTPIPNATTLSALYGIVVPSTPGGLPSNDDIVFSFDNREIQQQTLNTIKGHMERIGAASLRELQYRTAIYRQTKLAAYQAKVAQGKDVAISELDISNDANAPKFLLLDDSVQGLANRRSLGVDEDFNIIERKLPNNAALSLNAPVPALPTDPLVITVTNGTKATPWGTSQLPFKFQVKVIPKTT